MKARIIIDLPNGCCVWKVLALKDGDYQPLHPPIDCQIIGPVAFETKKPTKRKARKAKQK